jgi:hypothetical protein
VVVDVFKGTVSHNTIPLRFIQEFAVGAVRSGLSARDIPVPEVWTEIGGITVGLYEHRSCTVGEHNWFLKGEQVPNNPRTDDNEC